MKIFPLEKYPLYGIIEKDFEPVMLCIGQCFNNSRCCPDLPGDLICECERARDWPIMLIFYLLCYAAVLKILTYYAQYYAHVKDLYVLKI